MERNPMKISYPVLLSSSPCSTLVMYSPRFSRGNRPSQFRTPMSMATVMEGSDLFFRQPAGFQQQDHAER